MPFIPWFFAMLNVATIGGHRNIHSSVTQYKSHRRTEPPKASARYMHDSDGAGCLNNARQCCSTASFTHTQKHIRTLLTVLHLPVWVEHWKMQQPPLSLFCKSWWCVRVPSKDASCCCPAFQPPKSKGANQENGSCSLLKYIFW